MGTMRMTQEFVFFFLFFFFFSFFFCVSFFAPPPPGPGQENSRLVCDSLQDTYPKIWGGTLVYRQGRVLWKCTVPQEQRRETSRTRNPKKKGEKKKTKKDNFGF
jgi:hypothetical protein